MGKGSANHGRGKQIYSTGDDDDDNRWSVERQRFEPRSRGVSSVSRDYDGRAHSRRGAPRDAETQGSCY